MASYYQGKRGAEKEVNNACHGEFVEPPDEWVSNVGNPAAALYRLSFQLARNLSFFPSFHAMTQSDRIRVQCRDGVKKRGPTS